MEDLIWMLYRLRWWIRDCRAYRQHLRKVHAYRLAVGLDYSPGVPIRVPPRPQSYIDDGGVLVMLRRQDPFTHVRKVDPR